MSQQTRVGPLASSPRAAPALDVDRLLDDPDTRIIVCCGSGGVGKTTTSAALALRAAERGRKVVVLTIDPARRLAQSMGIETLDNTPRPVPGVGGSGFETGAKAPSSTSGGGSLDAMMLDMKRTFDEVVETQASPEKAKQILENPFYIALSSSFAGTQEYMAMEKLGQLHRDAMKTGAYDLIVVDTPPSRSALDFLDAPERLSSFLDGRFIRLMLAPARGPARLMTAGVSIMTNTLTKILGAQILRDMQTFVAAFDTLFGGFRARATKTFELLQADGTAFLVVAAPEADALREAAYFVERLSADRMPLCGLVINRASSTPGGSLSADEATSAATRLRRTDPDSLTAGLLRLQADRVRMVERETHLRSRFAAAHPRVATVVVPALSTDVHDLDGLRRIGACWREMKNGPDRGNGQDRRTDVVVSTSSTTEDGLDHRGTGSTTEGRARPPRTASGGRAQVAGLGSLEHGAPGAGGPTAEQRAALPLGHAAPDTPFDLVVERLSETLVAYGAGPAHLLCLVLLGSTHEQMVRLRLAAKGRRRPVFDPHDCSPNPSRPKVSPSHRDSSLGFYPR